MVVRSIKLPLTEEIISSLKTGDEILLDGNLYTARDAVHKRLYELVQNNETLPIDLKGQIIYYVGPTPPIENAVIGSAGPTTSDRMDPFTPALLARGLKGMIGKGPRSLEVKEAIVKYRAIYFGAIGGAGALLSSAIKSVQIVAYKDLGTEAIRELTVKEFPVIVINDIYGNDLYGQRDRVLKEK